MQRSPNMSTTVYVRGISKLVTLEDIRRHFETCGTISTISFSESPRQGYCWVTYEIVEYATAAVLSLHHSRLVNATISVRYELGKSSDGTFVSQPSPAVRRSATPAINVSVAYTSRGVMVNQSLYPISTGQYLLQLLQLRHSNTDTALLPYFDALLALSNSNKHTKELTEVMAMVNAMKVLTHRGCIDVQSSRKYVIYVLADGQIPLTAAIIALHYPCLECIYSIDPLLETYTETLDRIHVFAGMSQDFRIPATPDTTSIIIACHSHAPLQEFWDRVATPKYAITMPCCSIAYSSLDISPIDQYDDFEVYSPKRRICLYEAI